MDEHERVERADYTTYIAHRSDALAQEPIALIHAILISVLAYIGDADDAVIEQSIRRQWNDDPDKRAEMERAYQATLASRRTC